MNMYYQAMPPRDGRQPLTAAVLSIIPGLGQFYVGDKRKGILFVEVAIINYIVLSIIIFSHGIAKALGSFAQTYKFTLNTDLVGAINNAHFGSPSSILFIGAMLLFIWYAACDAYDKAFGVKRKQIYGDSIIDLSEATSGSYVGHIAMMLSCLLLAILFVKAPDHPRQITEIVFEMDQNAPHVKKPPVTPLVSKHNTEDVSKRKIQEPPRVAQKQASETSKVKPSEATPAKSATPPAPKPVPQPVTASAPPAPSHTVPMPPAPTPVVAHNELPAPTPAKPIDSHSPLPTLPAPTHGTAGHAGFINVAPLMAMAPPSLPMPTLSPTAHAAASTAPVPTAQAMPYTGKISVLPWALTGITGVNSAAPAFSGPRIGLGGYSAPGPVTIGTTAGTTGGGAPKLVAVGPTAGVGWGGCSGCGSTSGTSPTAPAPVRASSSSAADKGTGSPFAVAPTFHIGGPADTAGKLDNSYTASPTKDGRDGKPTVATKQAFSDVDFSAYMANLQRLIKKHWFPPSDTTSRRLSVTFKITRDGHMSNLQLNHSTGIQIADNAGLRAVEDAAPYFKALPDGAPEQVDIEFTFDYNVFNR